MKKLWQKISIHPITYLIVLSMFMCGLFKYFLIIGSIILIHELGHISFALMFKRKIDKIKLLPFGGLLILDSYLSENIFEDLIISIGGVFFQLIFIYILKLINISNFDIFNYYNSIIIIFNLIPICPLDGYKIIKLLMELFFPYKRCFKYGFTISIVSILFTCYFKNHLLFSNILVISFLIYQTSDEIKNLKYIMNRFYLERLHHKFNYKIKSNVKNIGEMYKNRHNYINGESEEKYLKRYFNSVNNT